MQSVWTVETLTPSPGSPSIASVYAPPYATWHVVFSSYSPSKKVSPVSPILDVPSTRATSPRNDAFSSLASCPRTTSAPSSAVTDEIRPSSNSSSSPRTMLPSIASGRVARTRPAVRRESGVVKTSSVGMLATYGRPSAV